MKKWQKIVFSVCMSAILCISATGCDTIKWLLSPQEQSSTEPLTAVETVYAKAQELGFKGTLEEFLELVKGADGKDGIDGADGKDGKDGLDGTDGKDGVDGIDGTDGKDGADGVGVLNAYLENGALVVELTNGKKINCGVIVEMATHTVSFDANGGEKIPSQEVKHGEKADKPTDPKKEGYIFDGWYIGEEKWSFIGYSVTEDITLTAKWMKIEDVLAGKKISILGDSISTFTGWSNNATETNSTIGSNRPYYTGTNIISSVNDTWWKKTVDFLQMRLLVNNSWSGSYVSDNNKNDKPACLDRAYNLYDNTGDNAGETPDIVSVYMGTNDFINNVTIGSFESVSDIYDSASNSYIGNTKEFASAYAIMLHKIKTSYPNAKVFCFTILPNVRNTNYTFLDEINQTIRDLADYFDCELVDLYNNSGITVDNLSSLMGDGLHPNAVGMTLIAECFERALIEAYKN